MYVGNLRYSTCVMTLVAKSNMAQSIFWFIAYRNLSAVSCCKNHKKKITNMEVCVCVILWTLQRLERTRFEPELVQHTLPQWLWLLHASPSVSHHTRNKIRGIERYSKHSEDGRSHNQVGGNLDLRMRGSSHWLFPAFWGLQSVVGLMPSAWLWLRTTSVFAVPLYASDSIMCAHIVHGFIPANLSNVWALFATWGNGWNCRDHFSFRLLYFING